MARNTDALRPVRARERVAPSEPAGNERGNRSRQPTTGPRGGTPVAVQQWVARSQAPPSVSRTRGVLGGIVLLALAPYAIYMMVANAALNTGALARWVNGAQQDLVLSIDSGWTAWPARLHVRGLTLRFEDENVQFALRADRIATSIDVRAGLRKEFHTFWVRGDGVSYWFRHKLDKIAGNEFRVAGFPIIPGYDPVPLRVPRPPSTTATEDLWVVRLDDVRARVRDFWMMEFRFLGDAHVSGSFELAPRRHLWVKDARLKFARGKLDRGEVDSIASRFSGTIEAEYPARNPDVVSMEQNLAWTNWGFELRADVDKVDVLAGYLEPGVRVHGGRGPLRIALRTRDQRFVHGSRASYSSRALTVRTPALHARLEAAVAFHTRRGSTRIDVTVPHAVLDTKAGIASTFTVDNARGFVAFDHARLDRAWHAQAIDARVGSARTGADGFRLPGGFRLDGKARAKLVGRADKDGRLAGDVYAHVLPAHARVGKHSGRGMGAVHARFLTRPAWLEGGTLFDVRAELDHVTARSGDDKLAGWWFVAESPLVEYAGTPPRSLRATVLLYARDARPLIAALEEEGEIPGVVGLLWTADHLQGHGFVRMQPGSLDIELKRMTSSSLGAKGRYLRVAARERAVFLVGAGPIGMGLELGDKGLSTSMFAGDGWFASRTNAVFGGTPRSLARAGGDQRPSRAAKAEAFCSPIATSTSVRVASNHQAPAARPCRLRRIGGPGPSS